MKFFLVLSLVVATCHANPLYGGLVNTGNSAVSRSDDGHGNYAFGYNEDHATGGTFRKEKGGPGVQVGSYGLKDADGRIRVVNYVADIHGFRASVSTNEPGTDPKQDPAATSLTYGSHLDSPLSAIPEPIISAEPLLTKSIGYAPQPLLSKAIIAPIATSYGADLLQDSGYSQGSYLGSGQILDGSLGHY